MNELLSKAGHWLLSMLVALFAVEIQPVVGVLILQGFELFTTVHALREEGLRAAEPYRRTLWREMRRRFWLFIGLSMALVYANVIQVEAVKVVTYTVAGGLFFSLGWKNLMKSNPLMQMIWRAVVRELRERGVDLDPDQPEEEVKA